MDASRHQLTVAPRSCALKRWQSASRLGFETKRPPVQIRPPRPDQKACDSHQVSSWLAARRTLLIWLVTVLAVGMAVAAGVVIEGRTAFGANLLADSLRRLRLQRCRLVWADARCVFSQTYLEELTGKQSMVVGIKMPEPEVTAY